MTNTTAILNGGSLEVCNNGKSFTINGMWFDSSTGDTMKMLSEALFNCYEYTEEYMEDYDWLLSEGEVFISKKEAINRFNLLQGFRSVFNDVDALWDNMESLGYL